MNTPKSYNLQEDMKICKNCEKKIKNKIYNF